MLPPHESVDVEHGDLRSMIRVRMQLLHGANFNDPHPFTMPTYAMMKTR